MRRRRRWWRRRRRRRRVVDVGGDGYVVRVRLGVGDVLSDRVVVARNGHAVRLPLPSAAARQADATSRGPAVPAVVLVWPRRNRHERGIAAGIAGTVIRHDGNRETFARSVSAETPPFQLDLEILAAVTGDRGSSMAHLLVGPVAKTE